MRVLVVGAGQMGGGIAHVCAAAGHDVLLNDVSADAVRRGTDVIAKNLARAVGKGKLAQDQADATLSRIVAHLDLTKAVDVSIAIEAASEDEGLKKRIFTTLEAATPPAAILASNTSSISITMLGAVTKRAERVIGMHFMNPVPVMKLVEIIRGIATSDETYETVRSLAEGLGKTPV